MVGGGATTGFRCRVRLVRGLFPFAGVVCQPADMSRRHDGSAAHHSFVTSTLHAPFGKNRKRAKERRRKDGIAAVAHTQFHPSLGVPVYLQASGIEKPSCMGRASCSLMLQTGTTGWIEVRQVGLGSPVLQRGRVELGDVELLARTHVGTWLTTMLRLAHWPLTGPIVDQAHKVDEAELHRGLACSNRPSLHPSPSGVHHLKVPSQLDD